LFQQFGMLGHQLTLQFQQFGNEASFFHDGNIRHPSKVVKDLF